MVLLDDFEGVSMAEMGIVDPLPDLGEDFGDAVGPSHIE